MQENQSKPPLQNLLIFILLSAAILLGWMWLQPLLFPPPEKDQQAAKKTDKDKKPLPEPPAKVAWPWKHLPEKAQQRVAADVIAAPLAGPLALLDAGLHLAARDVQIAQQKKTEPPPEIKTFLLGDDTFCVRAVLTNLGGGVQKLTLTRFQAADWWGRPVYDKENKPVPLDLIQEDPFHPSFLMYHYPDPSMETNIFPDLTLGERVWRVEKESRKAGEQTVTFVTDGPKGYEHLRIRKTYTLKPDEYHLGLSIDIEEVGAPEGERRPFRYQITGAHGMPIEGGWYTTVFRNAMIGQWSLGREYLFRTLQTAQEVSYAAGGDAVPDPKAPPGSDVLQYGGTALQFFASMTVVEPVKDGDKYKTPGILHYARATHESEEKHVRIDAVNLSAGTVDVTFLDPSVRPQQVRGVKLLPRAAKDLRDLEAKPNDSLMMNVYVRPRGSEQVYVAGGFRHGSQPKPYLDDLTVRLVSAPVQVKANEPASHRFLLYHGPIKVRQLHYAAQGQGVPYDTIEHYAADLHLDTLTDYPTWPIFKTLFWTDLLILCTKAIDWLLNLLFRLVPNEALTILLLTVLVRGAMFPISRRQALMSIRMQELQPEIQKVREKYKDDPQQLQQKIWEVYRKNKVNPLGGCLPLFLQLPIFLGLYYALQESIRFRLASFLWIVNLAAPDMLFWWGEGFPWITDPDAQGGVLYLGPYFNILPIIAVAIMLVHQKLIMPPPTDEQQEMQQKMMKYMMVVIGIMFYKVAAGLCLYFIASSLWGMAERKLLPKRKAAPGGATPPSGNGAALPPPKPKPEGKRKGKKKGKPEKTEETAFTKARKLWEDILKEAKKK